MSRLVDRTLAGTVVPPTWIQGIVTPERARADHEALKRDLMDPETAIIVADNCAEYLYAGTDQEYFTESDFPCLAPPYPRLWIEWKRPSKAVSEVHGEFGRRQVMEMYPRTTAILIDASTADTYDGPKDQAYLRRWAEANILPRWRIMGRGILEKITGTDNAGMVRIWTKFDRAETELILHLQALGMLGLVCVPEMVSWTEGIKWLLNCASYLEVEKGQIVGPVGHWRIPVNASGRVVGKPRFGVIVDGSHDLGMDVVNSFHPAIFPALLAISFFHCKNVRLVDNDPPAKLSRAHQKRHNRPLTMYRTLEIKPMQEILRREGRADHVGIVKALHICRGHFKDYRVHGLFGKHKGIYWWDHQVRGTERAGTVAKDYRVKV